jgi:hypothetical protein
VFEKVWPTRPGVSDGTWDLGRGVRRLFAESLGAEMDCGILDIIEVTDVYNGEAWDASN